MNRRGGDDLEDDFVLDDSVAFDDDEGYVDIEEDTSRLLSDEEGNHKPATILKGQPPANKKRKRTENEQGKEKHKKKIKLAEGPKSLQTATSIAAQSPPLLADYLSAMQKKSFPTASTIELDDLRIPETVIADAEAWTSPRTLDRLPDFIAEALPRLHKRLSQKPQANGAPTLIFVTGAALRAADVARALKDERLQGKKGGEVAKLFAKHFKVQDQIAYLKKTKIGAVVGTPGRIGKLLCDTDALVLSALTHVILDVTFRDAKERSLLDIPEVRDDVFRMVLGCPRMTDIIKAGKVQLVMF